MFKKVLAIVLSLTILLCISSPAFAAQDSDESPSTSTVRTVEEILNEYHTKSLSAQSAQTASAYSRKSGSDSKNLEQEAVDALTEAGYEAYNVTASNYKELENSLHTDFSDLGLDPEGSYIIIISCEDEEATEPNSSKARVGNVPVYDYLDPGTGGDYIAFDYDGAVYKLRYVTVAGTTAENSKTVQQQTVFDESLWDWLWESLVSILSGAIDKLNLGTFASILGLGKDDSNIVRGSYLTLSASAEWTYKYIQVYDEQYESWRIGARSEYAQLDVSFSGAAYDCFTGLTSEYDEMKSATIYSPNYSESLFLKNNAVLGFRSGWIFYDKTGNLAITLTGQDGTVREIFTLYEG